MDEKPKKLAPRMILVMEILQTNLMELEARIDQELSKNPALEYVVDNDSSPGEHNKKQTKTDAAIVQGVNETREVQIGSLVRKLKIKEEYLKQLESDSTTDAEREFIKSAVHSGQWLIEAIDQRSSMLKKVVSAVAQHQNGFIKSGDSMDIAMLKFDSIAEKIGVHVTTVSRVVEAKSIETPHGVFPLLTFFSNTIEEMKAAIGIREAIQKAVDEEDKTAPLKDEQLVDRLKTLGFRVARRTVTKYRKILNIPSSRQRRKYPDQDHTDTH